MAARDVFCHVADDGLDLVWHGAAIGVAQHHPARPGIVRRFGAGEREIGVLLVAVEEVLAIDHHLAPRRLRSNDAVADRGEVFLVGGLQRHPHLISAGFGDKADRIGLGLDECRKPRIVRGRTARTARHAERREFCALELRLVRKEFGVGRIGAGIAALDIVDAEFIQHVRDDLFVMQREIDAVGLRAVAQGGVEEIKAFAGHLSVLNV